MARVGLSLLLAAALVALATAGPVPQPQRSSAPRARSPLDLLDDRTRSLAPDMADPLPPSRARASTKVPRLSSVKATGNDPYRLPTNLLPLLYQVTLTPNFNDFTFAGDALIIVNCVEDTDEIVMHSKQLNLKASTFVIVDDRSPYFAIANLVNLTYEEKYDFVRIKLDTKLTKGNRYRFDVEFSGILNDDLDGFYRSSYKTKDGETRWLATTQFESTGARRAFPCWDEPSMKARFYIILNHDSSRNAISNMPTAAPPRTSGNSVMEQYDGTLPMSTYLIAFIVSDFGSISNCNGNFTVWARKDILQGGKFSQDIGQQALKLLAEYNGIEYALPKEDQAALPDFSAGAMENWGLVTYREEYLIEQDTQNARIAEYMMTTICHELGHQWTGDLVTLDWWSHTWLNEGFADYFENFICNQINPDWHLRDKAVVYDHHQAMESDALETQHAMSSPVSTPEEDQSKFDRISYSKGGAVIRMWEYMLGLDVLRAGLHRYLSIHMFSNTNPEHLFKAIDVEAQKAKVLPDGVSFPDIGRTWTEQPGVPVVSAVRDYAAKTITLNQQRFFYAPPSRPSLVDQRWFIPITMRQQGDQDWDNLTTDAWLRPEAKDMVVPVSVDATQWVLLNPKEIGYYRVNYDQDNWNLLGAALTANKSTFPSATRAQLLNDAVSLARGKQLDYGVAMQFFNFLKSEREVAPWQAATAAINFLRTKLAGTDAWSSFLLFLRHLTDYPYESVGYGGSSDHETRYLRYYVVSLACYAGNSDCIGQANNVLKAWLVDSSIKVDADTKPTSLCYGLRGADADANFQGLKAKWMAEKDADTRSTLLTAIACAQGNLLNRLLTDAINNNLAGVDQNEVVALWKAVLNRPEQVNDLLAFAEQNYKQIDTYFSSSDANSGAVKLLSNCIEAITSPSQLSDVRYWVEATYKGQNGYDALQMAFLEAYKKMDWYRSSYEAVAAWLKSNA